MIGESLLHYAILDKMGAGGMGVVYRALDTKLGRHVALKFLPEPARLDATARARLLAEAQAAARVDHPNIGVIHAIEDAADHPFIVMALYEGESLRDRLDRGPLLPTDATDIAIQAARALARAHESGVVHRDVKPDNLFLTSQGTVKVLDFGLAKLDRMDGLTSAGTVVGTLEYMSPEQIRGQPVDARTDLWALGVVLYETLTRVSPFRTEGGMTASILTIIKDEPPPVTSLRPEVGADLATVIERALVKDRDARYASAADMLADLEAVARGSRPLPLGAASAATASASAPLTPAPQAPPPAVRSATAPPTPAAPATAVARAIVNAVPTPTTPLVGREAELAVIATNLDDPHCRILTLFGPGGTGKTRLATEAARQAIERGAFTGGVVFVALDALDDAELIPHAIARALGVDLRPEAPALDQVQDAVGDRSLLLVLDNYEHVMDGAHLPSELIAACSGLRILATSRERLNLDEEWVLPLPGLAVPHADATDQAVIEGCEAVQLFLHRARRARHHFALEDEGPEHVGRICRLVAGSPLGIELAASWVKMMGCDEIAREIQANVDFLESTSRNVSERHRSIRACFEYSWTLLSPKEQDVLARLATFHGAFSRDAANAVAGATLPLLAALVDKSLLQAEGKRFESHPLLRQYAAEKLAERPAVRDEVEARHGSHFLAFVRGVRGQADELGQLDRDLPEILTAVQRAAERGDGATLVAFMRELVVDGPYYGARGHTPRSLELLQAAIAAAREAGDLTVAGRLLGKLGDRYLLQQGQVDPALTAYREALALAEQVADPHRQAIMLSLIGHARFVQGADDADAYLDRALALAREHGDALALNHVLHHQALHAGHRGEWQTAQALFAEALQVIEAKEDVPPEGRASVPYQTFMTLLNLGEAERMLGAVERSLEVRHRALRMAEERDNQMWRAYALHELGETYHGMGDRERAEEMLGLALDLWQRHNVEVKVRAVRLFMQQEGYEPPAVARAAAGSLANRA